MVVRGLEISLDCANPNLVYFGGSVIEGVVRFTVDEEPISARGTLRCLNRILTCVLTKHGFFRCSP